MNRYLEYKNKKQEEFNKFPMKFAFSDKQFEEAMKELGLTPEDTDKVVSIGCNGFIKKEDSQAFVEMINRNKEEFERLVVEDKTGEGFICDMFDYELRNHEYGYVYSQAIEETLDCLGFTEEDVAKDPRLSKGLEIAKGKVLRSYGE